MGHILTEVTQSLVQNYTGTSLQFILEHTEDVDLPSYETHRMKGTGWSDLSRVDPSEWLEIQTRSATAAK